MDVFRCVVRRFYTIHLSFPSDFMDKLWVGLGVGIGLGLFLDRHVVPGSIKDADPGARLT